MSRAGERQKVIKKLNKCFDDLDKLEKETKRKLTKDIVKCFNQLKKEVIGDAWHLGSDSFYGDYSPMYYHRRFDLYHVPQIDKNAEDGELKFFFNSDRMTQWHRVYKKLGPEKGKEYLYTIALERGYHGGATSGGPDNALMKHPHPGSWETGIPWWRRPPKRYPFWGHMAYTSGYNVLDRYEDLFKERVEEIREKYDKIYNKEEDKIDKEFLKLLQELKDLM